MLKDGRLRENGLELEHRKLILVLQIFLLDDELWQMGAYILIECKNWKKHVGIQQIRNIAHISSMKGNKTAILFTANGITSDSQEEIQRLAMTNIYIICITAVELKQLQSAVE
mgnify:CR=1 FL=1